MLNPALDRLTDYPFQRLRDLLDGVSPPAGVEPLVLSIGEPQHPPPGLVADTLSAHAGEWNRYPPLEGTPEWRAAVAGWLERRYGVDPEAIPDRCGILPVAGTREALFMVASVAVPKAKQGRRPAVLLPNPFYQVYLGGAVLAGADPVFVPATAATGFQPDLSGVDPGVWARTALVYLCSPGNPQGAAAGRERLADAIARARAADAVLVVDECYSEIHAGTPPVGALQVCAETDGRFDNVLVFHSLSKRSNVPGLRSGFVAGDPRLVTAFARLRSYAGATLGLPVQAASAALWDDEDHVEANRALYRAKFDVAGRILSGRFGFYRPDGGFFLWLDVGEGEDAARRLWAEAGLRVLPGAYLARPGADGTNPGRPYVRLALVHDADVVETALTRLRDVLAG